MKNYFPYTSKYEKNCYKEMDEPYPGWFNAIKNEWRAGKVSVGVLKSIYNNIWIWWHKDYQDWLNEARH